MDTTQAQPDAERKQDALPAMTMAEPTPASAYWWKRAEICFVSECRHLDVPGRAATLAYTYPQSHPFTKGHFPGNPVMMGITQWAAASDATDWLAFKLIEAGEAACPCDVSADVVIQKADGTVVAEVSGLVNRYQRDAEGRLFSETISTKRIGFRDMARPGDELVYGVSADVRQ